jgi:homoserine O-acetyltransferase/O-succinyltransferase
MGREAGSIGIVETRLHTFAEPPNELELDCGRKLGPITLAYETYGTLNADKSNAVLLVHALSGDAHAAGMHHPDDRKPGWWDSMVGPGKGFDTDEYFVICSNVIGGCQGSTGPASVNPATGKAYGLDFPIITMADMVRAQSHLIDHLGIRKLLCVVGGSMGGMQTLEWMTLFPDRVCSAIVIASTALVNAQAIAFDAVGRNAIQADPCFENGAYYGKEHGPVRGLSIARMLAHITYLSDESMRRKFGRSLRNRQEYSYDFESEFAVETYLDYQGEQFVDRFDANSYLYITKAINYFDMPGKYGSLDEAMGRVNARTMVLSYSSDWLYPPNQSQGIVDALIRQKKDVSYCNIQSAYGHDGFLLEVDVMKKLIGGFLEHVYHRERVKQQDIVEVDSEAEFGPPPVSAENIYEGHRVDYEMIVDLVGEGSRVLDIGCGDGALLNKLIAEKNVDGVGVELSQGNVVSCVRRGVPVIQADINKGLGAIPDKSYDYVILSMTLQVISETEKVLNEMLRVGKRCIISFPNFGYWKVRANLLLRGRAPVTRNLPYSWHTTPNRHVLSIRDFRTFCHNRAIRIEREIPLGGGGTVGFWRNMLAEEALFVIAGK